MRTYPDDYERRGAVASNRSGMVKMVFFLGIAGWILVGVIVGVIASRVVDLRGDDPRLGIGLGAGGGLIGGWLYSWISGSQVAMFNVWSLLVAGALAVVAVTVWHVVRRRAPYAQPTIRRSY